MTVVSWQALGDIAGETAFAMNRGCHDAGLRKQNLGYHNSWDCCYFILLVWFWVLHCVNVGTFTDGRWELAATYCNTIRCHHCGMVLYTDPGRSTPHKMPASSSANIRVTVDTKCLHYLELCRKLQQSVY